MTRLAVTGVAIADCMGSDGIENNFDRYMKDDTSVSMDIDKIKESVDEKGLLRKALTKYYDRSTMTALDLVDKKDRSDFSEYLNTETSTSLWNLFCCKSPKLLEQWYETVFDWLFKCEKVFGFKDLREYETGRMYAYLAERYLPFWFKKYSKTRTWPIYFHDSNLF